ncbi:MAG: TonB-dependent receptor, partial [Betaproteobacteria bacterium]|nr:TonB-dependent receptor [Betaproteobacteria bacterium]
VLAQQFNGRPLPRAPEFSGSFGFNYETDVSDNWNVGINANGVYTSKQYLSQELSPIGFSPSRLLLDAGLSFSTKSKSMTFQVIGRNLTDKHFGVTANGSFGTGVSSTTGTATGIISDYEGPVSRGREIWLKVTIRPSEF